MCSAFGLWKLTLTLRPTLSALWLDVTIPLFDNFISCLFKHPWQFLTSRYSFTWFMNQYLRCLRYKMRRQNTHFYGGETQSRPTAQKYFNIQANCLLKEFKNSLLAIYMRREDKVKNVKLLTEQHSPTCEQHRSCMTKSFKNTVPLSSRGQNRNQEMQARSSK